MIGSRLLIKYLLALIAILILIMMLTACASNYPNTDIIYKWTTPKHNIQVSVDDLLQEIDKQTDQFMDCQFGGYTVVNILPLSNMRVFVLDGQFKCDSTFNKICKGEYDRNKDLMILSKIGWKRIFRHELAHRYGYTHVPDNFSIYKKCIEGFE